MEKNQVNIAALTDEELDDIVGGTLVVAVECI
jgi:hypothetical protein